MWHEAGDRNTIPEALKRASCIACVCVVLVVGFAATTVSQIYYNPNDERYKQLALEKSVWVYLERRDADKLAETLLEKGLLSHREYIETQRTFKVAEVELKQAILASLQDVRAIVLESVKRQIGSDNEIRLIVQLRNAATNRQNGGLDSLLSSVSSDFLTGDLLTIRNLIVSLESEGVAVCLPYERTVDQMLPGQSVDVEFKLLRDVNEVTVVTSFAGQTSRRGVVVQQDVQGEGIRITATPIAQEAQFQNTVYYDLTFSRVDTKTGNLDLLIQGAPSVLALRFKDPATGAFVRRLLFPEAALTHRLRLEASLPDRPSDSLKADTNIQMTVVIQDPTSGKTYGSTRIELQTLGRGQLDLFATNWALQGSVESPPTMEVDIQNTGSSRLTDVRFDVRGPAGWEFTITPSATISMLEPGSTERVQVLPVKSDGFESGIFEIEMRARSFGSDDWIYSSWKTYRLELETERSLVTISIVGLLVLALVALVIFGALRLTKR